MAITKPQFLYRAGLRLLLFGGKGGVGKTTCAVATALYLAEQHPQGKYLLLSTDPAHSVADSLAELPVPSNLLVRELDAKASMERFMERNRANLREVAARGTFLDDEDISQLLDLTLPGLDELMAFIEVAEWVEQETYAGIIVDTAPTGHTLRFLHTPQLIRQWLGAVDSLLGKHRYMKRLFSGSYHPDHLDRFLLDLTSAVDRVEDILKDPERSCFVPVFLAEGMSLQETLRLAETLCRMEIPFQEMVVNQVFPESDCRACTAVRGRQLQNLSEARDRLGDHPLWCVPIYPEEARGSLPLHAFWEQASRLEEQNWIQKGISGSSDGPVPRVEMPGPPPRPPSSLILFAGKGGVGKTTLACATAVHMAQERVERAILLFSSDPAHSVSDCLETPVGGKPTPILPGLAAVEMDGQAEFDSLKRAYQDELESFLDQVAPNMELTFDQEVMERMMDLSPPGLDEVMALTKALDFLTAGDYETLILDTAPTGHLVRLLELPELIDQWLKVFFDLFLKYKRIFRLPGVSKKMVQISKDVKSLRSMLKDPERSALYGVTVLTHMAWQETMDLWEACARMKVPFTRLFLNLTAPEGACTLCTALRERESNVRSRFNEAFPEVHQTGIQREGEPRGSDILGGLGARLYNPPAPGE